MIASTKELVVFSHICLFVEEVLTCWQGEGHQISEEIAGEVSLALVKRGRYLATDLLRELRTHHGWNTLGCLLGHLQRGDEIKGRKHNLDI